jgi:hypothetical protein
MLKKVFLVVSLAVVLAMALASVGCASGNNGLTDMLAKVPEDAASLKYVNVKALRNDADLNDLYDAWKTGVDARLEAHGIDHGDVSVFAFGTGSAQRFTLLVGKFDLDEVRGELENRHYDDDEYKGVEVWTKEAGWGSELDSEVAIMGNLIILGNESGVEGCIKVIKEGDPSWLTKADIKDVVNSLPRGIYMDVEKTLLGVSNLEAYGVSAEKQDGDTLGIAGVAKFDDEDDADDAENAVEYWMNLAFEDVDVDRDGVFLKGSAEVDIDDAASMFQGV